MQGRAHRVEQDCGWVAKVKDNALQTATGFSDAFWVVTGFQMLFRYFSDVLQSETGLRTFARTAMHLQRIWGSLVVVRGRLRSWVGTYVVG
jgi:hypothetical protein